MFRLLKLKNGAWAINTLKKEFRLRKENDKHHLYILDENNLEKWILSNDDFEYCLSMLSDIQDIK